MGVRTDMSDFDVQIESKIQQHLTDFHGTLEAGEGEELVEEHRQMVKDTTDNKQMLERMVKAIEGSPKYDLGGHVVGYTGGMVNQINELEERTKNGGLNAKFIPTQAQLWTFWIGAIGIMTALTYLVVAVFGAQEMRP